MSNLSRETKLDPVGSMTRSERRFWRRAERRVIRDHRTWLLGELKRLKGESVLEVVTDHCIAALDVGDRRLVIAEVVCAARQELLIAARSPCHLDAGGRYGRYWWIEIAADGRDAGGRVVIAGTHLSVIHDGGGREGNLLPLPVLTSPFIDEPGRSS